MQAIITKYISATNFKGSRIQAKCEAKTIYVEYTHELNTEQNHIEAAKKIATKLGWNGEWVNGSTSNGYVFVCVKHCEKFEV